MKNEAARNSKLVTEFSISAEELALIFSMAGHPEQGRQALKAAHANLDQLDMDSLLSSAGHSLLARSLCQTTSTGQLKLQDVLEMAVSVVFVNNEYHRLNMVSGKSAMDMSIYMNAPRSFCTHLNKANLVHLLEYGEYRSLDRYFGYLLQEVVTPEKMRTDAFENTIPLDLLPASLETPRNGSSTASRLKDLGWPTEHAEMLSVDLAHQVVRGSLIRVKGVNNITEEQFKDAPKSAFLFLRGAQRSWAFTFPTMEPSAAGQARLVDRDLFNRSISAFVKQ